MESSRHKDESAWDGRPATSGERIEDDSEDIAGTTTLNNNGEKQITSAIDAAQETLKEKKNELVKIFEKTAGIFEYCIFDERDILQDKSAESKATVHIAPSLHFYLSDSICDLVGGGSLRYLGFSTHSGVRYLLLRMNKSQVVIGLNPGIKPGDFFNEISADTMR